MESVKANRRNHNPHTKESTTMAETATPTEVQDNATGEPAAPKQRTPKPKNACQCFSTRTGDTTDEGDPIFRACGQTTSGTYAPGHDAKLKSVLLELSVNGQQYHRQDGGILTSGDPAAMARDLNWGHFVDRAVESASQRKEARAAREQRAAERKAEREQVAARKAEEKAAAKAAKAESAPALAAGRKAQAKIGRQVRDVEIVGEDGDKVTVRYAAPGGSGKMTTSVIARDKLVEGESKS
jgi:hypothetical protein